MIRLNNHICEYKYHAMIILLFSEYELCINGLFCVSAFLDYNQE